MANNLPSVTLERLTYTDNLVLKLVSVILFGNSVTVTCYMLHLLHNVCIGYWHLRLESLIFDATTCWRTKIRTNFRSHEFRS